MCTASKPQSPAYPVKAASNYQKVNCQNARVPVLRSSYGRRETSVIHSHPHRMAVFLNDQHSRFTLPDGKTEENRFKAGQTMWLPGGSHLPENLTDEPFEVLLVELK